MFFDLVLQLPGVIHAFLTSFDALYRRLVEPSSDAVCTNITSLENWKEQQSPFLSFVPVHAEVEPSYLQTNLQPEEVGFVNELVAEFAAPLETETKSWSTVRNNSEVEVYLSMDDYETEGNVATVSHSNIASQLLGHQEWQVEIVGQESGYYHVSDGSGRAWVFIGDHYDISKGDILKLKVERLSEDNVQVQHIELLQKKSFDYVVVDEEEYDWLHDDDEEEQAS